VLVREREGGRIREGVLERQRERACVCERVEERKSACAKETALECARESAYVCERECVCLLTSKQGKNNDQNYYDTILETIVRIWIIWVLFYLNSILVFCHLIVALV
jgi:hypothetical protein